MAIKPYLQLIRLPNVLTAAADSLAGWLLITGSLAAPARWLPLVLASMAIYAGGIALNDVFDFEIDLRERPSRPLPSGRISRKFASRLGWSLLLAGPLLAALSGSLASFAVASILATCVLAYDAGAKKTLLGPIVMGSCRGLNLLLGMSQDPNSGGPGGWIAAGSLALFVVGITVISRSEVETGRRAGTILGSGLQLMALVGLFYASTRLGRGSPYGPGRHLLLEFLLLYGSFFFVWRADLRAVLDPVPARLQAAVKTGVLTLIWLDVGVVALTWGFFPALAVAALWPPAFLLGRKLYST